MLKAVKFSVKDKEINVVEVSDYMSVVQHVDISVEVLKTVQVSVL